MSGATGAVLSPAKFIRENLTGTALSRRRGGNGASTVLRRFFSRRKAAPTGDIAPFCSTSERRRGDICSPFHPMIHCEMRNSGTVTSLGRKGAFSAGFWAARLVLAPGICHVSHRTVLLSQL